jgi:hypothetical protein
MQWYSSILIYHITSNIRLKFVPVEELRYILNWRTREALMSKSKECPRNSKIPFQASCEWWEKFMKAENVKSRWMKTSQDLPSEFETEVIEFQHFVIGLCQRSKYSLSQIGTADETAVF